MMRTIVIAVLLVAGCKDKGSDGSGGRKTLEKSNADVAKVTAKKLAFEAYPQWAMRHPEKECPERLDELLEFAPDAGKDPWGAPYVMKCGASLPAGAKGFAVLSFGEDGKEGTADDVKSWD